MPSFTPKNYQQGALESIEHYFRMCQKMGNADYAFQECTKELWGRKSHFTPLVGFPEEMPYFCLRVPTGGGKTYLAAKSVALVNNHLLHTEYSVILWLVPSTAIREQTIEGLKNRDHPYHGALREAGAVNVISLEEAKSLNRSMLESSTVVIVATRQAFQVEKEEGRKVYEGSGELMHLFDSLTEEQKAELLPDEKGETTPTSLANALRLRRPFIIVDEAHNNRTELGFDTLAKFRPSGIMELTATPDTTKTPSNVLHSVSAVELKCEEMIKLPIQLETEPNEQKCLALAIDQREQLHEIARQDHANGAAYLRPLILIQSEPKNKQRETKHAEWVKNELITNHNIPENEIVIATGSKRGLEELEKEYNGGIFSDQCPAKFIITQKALAEGWDCAFAYILVSMAELKSATAIEQLLGRVLRQPQAKHREHDALNRSYAYVVSKDFGNTAATLRDSLIEASGFEHEEAADFVTAKKEEQAKLDFKRGEKRIIYQQVETHLTEEIDISSLPTTTKKKVKWSKAKKTLIITAPLSEEETKLLKTSAVMDTTKQAIEQAGLASRTEAVQIFQAPSELGLQFLVPQLEVIIDGELQLFDETETLDYPWSLPLSEAYIEPMTSTVMDGAATVEHGGLIDIEAATGRVKTQFSTELERDLGLSYTPEHWTEVKLAAWFCRQIHDPSITHTSKRAFISAWLSSLLAQEGMDLARVNRQKFLIRSLIEDKVKRLRDQAKLNAYQQFLFGDGREDRIRIGSEYTFEFHPDAYAPDRDYSPTCEYGDYDFQKHYYPRMGDFDSREEFACACWLDRHTKVQFWVRNLVRKNGSSFYLQTASGRFYPDFICKLTDGRTLIVEYKGSHLYDSAKVNRQLGNLWAELSEGHCLFVMVTDKNWSEIESVLN